MTRMRRVVWMVLPGFLLSACFVARAQDCQARLAALLSRSGAKMVSFDNAHTWDLQYGQHFEQFDFLCEPGQTPEVNMRSAHTKNFPEFFHVVGAAGSAVLDMPAADVEVKVRAVCAKARTGKLYDDGFRAAEVITSTSRVSCGVMDNDTFDLLIEKRGAPQASFTPDDHYFPARPVNRRPETMEGVLVDYGVGNASGSLTLKTAKGKVDFYVGASLKVNGKPMMCTQPPSDSPDSCAAWPQGLTMGKTRVRVTYWHGERHMSETNTSATLVTDEIDTLN